MDYDSTGGRVIMTVLVTDCYETVSKKVDSTAVQTEHDVALYVVAIQMGRPSKHRLQTTASLRQRDVKLVKLAEDSDENGWHGHATSTHQHPGNVSADSRLTATHDALMRVEDQLMMRDGEMKVLPMTSLLSRRTRSFGSECTTVSDVINSDSNSSCSEMSPKLSSSSLARDTRNSYVSVKVEQSDIIVPPDLSSPSSSSSSHCVSTADKQFTVSWQGGHAAGRATSSSKQQHVLSGGYCCELRASPVSSPMVLVADHFCTSPPPPPTYSLKTSSMSLAATDTKCDSVMADVGLCSEQPATATLSHRLSAMSDKLSAVHTDVTVSDRSTMTVQSPDDAPVRQLTDETVDMSQLTDVSQTVDMSPGSKWHIASDRDSPYVSVMALASTCHLFSESCPSNSSADDDTALDCDQTSSRYWLEPDLPDENVIFTEKHCEMINQITAAYDRYVQTGTIINETLVTEMKVRPVSLFTSLHKSMERLEFSPTESRPLTDCQKNVAHLITSARQPPMPNFLQIRAHWASAELGEI